MDQGMTTFLARLDQLRGRTPVTGFAEECGIKHSTMRNYLEGKTPPTLPAVLSIARAKGITVGWLVGEDPPVQGGHSANGATGVMQAGGSVSGSIQTGGETLTDHEMKLITKLRQVGSPVMIDKIMKQLQDLEDFLLQK